MNQREIELRNKIIKTLEDQGFEVGDTIKLKEHTKEAYHKIQEKAKLFQLKNHKDFLLKNISKIKEYCRDGKDIEPDKISLEFRIVQSNTLENILFNWWNYTWWSMPYQPSYGRRIRLLVWDKFHNMPFGLIVLQSPVMHLKVRDDYLGIPKEEKDYWINQSMYAQRLGALPPYNELLGGKMVALSIVSNEIRNIYKNKYKDKKTVIKGRILNSDLLFITTTSAFGRSSIYNRLKYKNELIARSLGYTQGYGVFHIPDDLYREILKYLQEKGIEITFKYNTGSSKKMSYLSKAFRFLELKNFSKHGLKREVFLFSLVKNLKEVIKYKEDPVFYNYSFEELLDYWKQRWAIPRSQRKPQWKDFKCEEYLNKVMRQLDDSSLF